LLEKHEIFVQLVRQEVTAIEPAGQRQVDRGVIMRIRTVAKEGVLETLSKSRPGLREKERGMELLAPRTEAARLGDALKRFSGACCTNLRGDLQTPW
jgi:hypothetical protein